MHQNYFKARNVKFMSFGNIFFASLVATTVMTLFSYGVSVLSGKQFREPELLNALFTCVRTKLPGRYLGWFIHYLVGILFVAAFELAFRFIQPGLKSYLTLGFAGGIFGVMIWHLTFSIHPRPPVVTKPAFYGQLIIAHIIFGAGAYLYRSAFNA